jgi:hypothetical protein
MSIDMERIEAVQRQAGWSSLEGVINLLEENGTISAGQKSLTDQQIAVIDGQRRINGGLLDAITQILDSLAALEASVAPIQAREASAAATNVTTPAASPEETKTGANSKIDATRKALKGLLGDVPPGCRGSN